MTSTCLAPKNSQKNFRKLDLKVNVLPLRTALKENPQMFGRLPYRGFKGGPHEQMKDIWLRHNDMQPYVDAGDFAGFNDEHDAIWYPEYYELPESKQIIFDLMRHVEGVRLGGILITKLPPGGEIYPHKDDGWHAGYYSKYYIPIENYEGAVFGFPEGEIRPQLGDVYWFRNSVDHYVKNNTAGDRIAMIICIKHEGGL